MTAWQTLERRLLHLMDRHGYSEQHLRELLLPLADNVPPRHSAARLMVKECNSICRRERHVCKAKEKRE